MGDEKRRVDRTPRSTLIALASGAMAAISVSSVAADARAADGPPDGPPDLASAPPVAAATLDHPLAPGDRALVDGETRFRLAPRVGGGIGFMGGHIAPFPRTVGITELGAELSLEIIPYGFWLQGTFESSGADGAWTAPSIGAGMSYRLFGDGLDRASLLLRGGVVWEAWHASTTACEVTLFVPSGCVSLPPRNPDGTTPASYHPVDDNAQMIGLLAGARLEVPIHQMYLAFDASFVPAVDVSGGEPGSAFTVRFAMLIGFRDQRVRAEKRERSYPDDRTRIRGR